MWDDDFISKKRSEFFDDEAKNKLRKALQGEYGVELLEEADENQPYIRGFLVQKISKYNPNYGDGRTCECGHPYYRHFDSYENDLPVGCKYCRCNTFMEAKEQ